MDDLSGGMVVARVVIRTPELHSNDDLSGCRVGNK
jgi:hypothetical protein